MRFKWLGIIEMSLYKDKGWDYLTSGSQGADSYCDYDGSWGYRNEDGSASYYGADGSWGYINSDGCGSYYGADGSWGNINPDGSSTYYGTDGSWENINSDGSSSYFESNERGENEGGFYDEDDEDDTNITTAGNGIAALLGLAIGFGIPLYMAYKNAKIEEERKEMEKRIEQEHIRKEKQKIKQKKRKIRNKRFKALLFNKKNIKTDISSDALVGNYVEYVTERIQEAGFADCTAIPIKDIYEGSDKKVGEVEQVAINGESCFDANTMFPYKAQVTISYHVKREIPFPISSKQIRKMTVENLKNELHGLGYTEINMEKIADLKTGWIHKDGSIEYVLVNGKSKYKKGDMFNYDVKIVIAYHTFAKKI